MMTMCSNKTIARKIPNSIRLIMWNKKMLVVAALTFAFTLVLFSRQTFSGDGTEEVSVFAKSFLDNYDIPCDQTDRPVADSWAIAADWTNHRSIQPDYAPELACILHHMSTAKIVHVDVGYKGSQNKLAVVLEGGQKAVFKPKWNTRAFVVNGDNPTAGNDRHNAEIVTYHLNRLLGYNRAPLAVGRVLNLQDEVTPVASKMLADTMFMKGQNMCIQGTCTYCKSQKDAACASGNLMEGTILLWLSEEWTSLVEEKTPWGRSYIGRVQEWEKDENHCDAVLKDNSYSTGPKLMDLIDTAIIDYLCGNADRHHFETFDAEKDGVIVLLDNAKGFGNPYRDEESIITPLRQCCRIRQKTYSRLMDLRDGVLSNVLERLTRHDPIYPILTPQHYEALDRRLDHIMDTVDTCLQNNSPEDVFVVDNY